MAASPVQGSWKHFIIPAVEGSHESSLTWCVDHIYKPAPPRAESPGHDSMGRDMDKKARINQWKALIAIRTQHIKGDRAGIARFRREGGLRPLLELIKHTHCSRKTLDVALSILGNCCTELETRVEVRKLDGINVVVEVLKRSVAMETVQNRAARVLGNLAMDPESSALIHSAGGVPLLLLCMSMSSASSSPSAAKSKDNSAKHECAQSAARALLYLSDTHSNRLSLFTQGTFPALAPLIAPEYPLALRRMALRALHELTRSCSVECAREVSRSGVLGHLGAMVLTEPGKPFEELALKTLANLCSQSSLRPLVGSLGVIPKFAEEVKKDPLKSGVFLKALCLCCKEAVNRAKVKESGGLEALISFLSTQQSHSLSRLPIMACVDFVFDESAMEQLQDMGLAPLLVARLVEFSREEEQSAEKMDVSPSSNTSPTELLPSYCFDSFDFPTLESCKKEESGKEQGSGSFLSLRSWLVSEGLISSEGDLLDSSGVEGEWRALHVLPPSSPPTSSLPPCSSTPLRNVSPAAPHLSSTADKTSCSHSSSSPNRTHPSLSSRSQPRSSTLHSATTKTSVSSSKFSSSHRRRHRASSKASLTKVTLDTPPSAPRPTAYHPYHPEPWTPESPILLLLSRFSHATDPSAALISSGVMSGLLLYLAQHKDPSSRCIRMLCRLSCNPNCLQALIRTGLVGFIQHFLCQRGSRLQGEDRQTDRGKAKVKQLGAALMNNLRVQCESAFGAGVVAHVMLSGSEIDKIHCALSLPFITSNKSLLKRLLLDTGGLRLALQPLHCDDDDDDKGHSADCRKLLSDLFNTPYSDLSAQLPSLYFSVLAECLSTLTASVNTELGKKRLGLLTARPHVGKVLPPPTKKPRPADTCQYSTASFDLLLLLDDGSRIPASRAAVAGLDEAEGTGSEYFRALLRGGFQEAQGGAEKAIPIKDVSSGMLLPVLHYLHGCRLTEEAESGGHCQVLDALVLDGLSICKAPRSTGVSFQKTPLGETMMGACRFLVDELQRELEDLCVSLLMSASTKASEEKTPCKIERDLAESAEESLAIRTSELELTGPEKQTEASLGQTTKTDAPLQQAESQEVSLLGAGQEIQSPAPVSVRPEEPKLIPKSESQGPAQAAEAASSLSIFPPQRCSGAAALSTLFPQVYWFSQRYSFPALRRSCLAVLLGCQDSPRPFSTCSAAGDCLRRLAREADCTDTLKQDVLSLVSSALS